MPSFYSDMPRTNKEPRSRFYPPQGTTPINQPPIPSAPVPVMPQPSAPELTTTPSQHSVQEMPTAPSQRPVQEMPTAPSQRPVQEMPTQPMPQENRIFSPVPTISERRNTPRERSAEPPYFEHRYPLMLQRLYDVSGAMLDTYSNHDFLYDTYPDYLSLRLMRDRLLRENQDLTEEFLQAGCPIMWLELLTDTIVSELLCRRRREKMNR